MMSFCRRNVIACHRWLTFWKESSPRSPTTTHNGEEDGDAQPHNPKTRTFRRFLGRTLLPFSSCWRMKTAQLLCPRHARRKTMMKNQESYLTLKNNNNDVVFFFCLLVFSCFFFLLVAVYWRHSSSSVVITHHSSFFFFIMHHHDVWFMMMMAAAGCCLLLLWWFTIDNSHLCFVRTSTDSNFKLPNSSRYISYETC